jgi:hypothetical protein
MVSVALDELEAQCAALQDDELTVLEVRSLVSFCRIDPR